MTSLATIHVTAAYSVSKATLHDLRFMFPDGVATALNFVIFSTSGTHGSYNTIEEIEYHLQRKELGFDDDDMNANLTFVIVSPRVVTMRYGNAEITLDDIEWLKRLRQSSWEAMALIGH